MDAAHQLHDLSGAAGVAQAPAGHGEGLGEAVQCDGALPHAGHCREAQMPLAAIGELGVDFIVDHENIGVLQNIGDTLIIRTRHYAAGRVVGVGENQRLRARRNRLLQRFRCDLEAGGHLRFHGHAVAAREGDAGHIGNVARVGHEHIVARFHQRAHGKVDALARTDGDQYLVFGVVFGAEALRLVAGDQLAQLQQTPVAGVVGVAAAQGVDGRVRVRPGRVEVRLAHAQGDDAVHLADDVEKLADAGGRHVGHAAAEDVFVVHGVIFSLLSACFSSVMTPSFL